MNIEIIKRKDVLEDNIRVLEWDKSHGQLNPGKNALLEGYRKELDRIKGAKKDE